MPVFRARGWLARLGPVWAILAISLSAAFLPTSVGAQTPNEPGRLDVVAGGSTCVSAPRGKTEGLGLFPEPSTAKAAKFEDTNATRYLAVDPAGSRLFIANLRPGMIGSGGMVSAVAPPPLKPAEKEGDPVDDGSGLARVVAFDATSERLFYGGGGNNRIMSVRVGSTGPIGTPERVAGAPIGNNSGPGALADVSALAVGGGKIYVAEVDAVRQMSTDGSGSRKIAGGGTAAPAVGLSATDIALRGAQGLAVGGGSLFIADTGVGGTPGRVIIVDPTSGTITGVVTNMVKAPLAVAVDAERDHLYVADSNRVLLFDTKGSYQRSVAGTGSQGALGPSHTWAKEAPLSVPAGLALDRQGNLFIGFWNACSIARVVKPAEAGAAPTTTPTTATPTTAAPGSNTTLPTATPPGNEAVQPGPANTPDPGGSTGANPNAGASPDPGGATGVDSNPGGVPDAGGATGGDFQFDPDAFGHTAFDLDSFGFGDSFNFDPEAFGAGSFDLDAFGEFDPSFGGAGVDGLDGMAGVEGGDPLGTGAQALPGAAPPPGAAPVQPASGPPIGGDGSSAHQAGLGASSGQSPRGASRYSMVARSDDGAPVAAVALAAGALALFTCFLVLAAAPSRPGTQVASSSRPRPRGAY